VQVFEYSHDGLNAVSNSGPRCKSGKYKLGCCLRIGIFFMPYSQHDEIVKKIKAEIAYGASATKLSSLQKELAMAEALSKIYSKIV
jgi:hypothetical protein